MRLFLLGQRLALALRHIHILRHLVDDLLPVVPYVVLPDTENRYSVFVTPSVLEAVHKLGMSLRGGELLTLFEGGGISVPIVPIHLNNEINRHILSLLLNRLDAVFLLHKERRIIIRHHSEVEKPLDIFRLELVYIPQIMVVKKLVGEIPLQL